MELGFQIFDAFKRAHSAFEVFPSASYQVLRDCPRAVSLEVDLACAARGPKDLIDALMCAATVREVFCGRGLEVGNGDGLGTIALPGCPSRLIPQVMVYPAAM